MSDFAQAGAICTLQQLNEAYLPALEEQLIESTRTRPIALILPCRGSDLTQPALAHILAELRPARWLREIVLSINGANTAQIEHVRSLTAGMPQRMRLLQPNVAPLAECGAELLGRPAEELPAGKGMNVWAALGCWGEGNAPAIIATQDADVSSFRRETLARLCAACVEPKLGFRFAKMYYSRVTDRLYGRVTRLFWTPLLRAWLRIAGHRPLLDFLLSFRYALAGEVALERSLAEQMRWGAGWGLETGMLCEVFQHADPETVCQVDGGGGYDHRHQAWGEGAALETMCGEIARTVLSQLAREGLALDSPGHAALLAAYRKEGLLALRRSEALAAINGLPFDAASERQIMEKFADQLDATDSGDGLPAWSALRGRQPAAVDHFRLAAARADR